MPGANCLLGVCCPPRSPAQKAAFAEHLCRRMGWSDAEHEALAARLSDVINDDFDLAPAGSLVQLKADIARVALEG